MESPDGWGVDCERRRSQGKPQGFSPAVQEWEWHCLPPRWGRLWAEWFEGNGEEFRVGQASKNLRLSGGDVQVSSWARGPGVRRSGLKSKLGGVTCDATQFTIVLKTNIHSNRQKSHTHMRAHAHTHDVLRREESKTKNHKANKRH